MTTRVLDAVNVKAMTAALKEAGLRMEIDWHAGTVEAFHKEKSIYKALEKSENGPWIVCYDENLFV
jgi:hypothetical protein